MITDLNARIPKDYYEPIEQSTKRIIKLVENFNFKDNKHIIKRNGELYFDEVAEKIIYTYLSLNLPAGYNSVPQYPSKAEISENQYRDGKNLFNKSKKRYVFQEKKSEENYKKNYDIEIF